LFPLFATDDTGDKYTAGVIETGGKFATGVVDTNGKFAASFVDTSGENLPPVLLIYQWCTWVPLGIFLRIFEKLKWP
jgi:hypothetical protein